MGGVERDPPRLTSFDSLRPNFNHRLDFTSTSSIPPTSSSSFSSLVSFVLFPCVIFLLAGLGTISILPVLCSLLILWIRPKLPPGPRSVVPSPFALTAAASPSFLHFSLPFSVLSHIHRHEIEYKYSIRSTSYVVEHWVTGLDRYRYYVDLTSPRALSARPSHSASTSLKDSIFVSLPTLSRSSTSGVIMDHSEEMMDAPDGSGFTWIFDHCVRYPGTYEIPLRTMYALNCNSMRHQGAYPTEYSFPPQPHHSPHSSESSHDTSLDAASDFRAQISHQISRLPSQPCSLPPSFITTFLRRSFSPHFDDVDWAQALTALDYLRDFETRRRKEVIAALKRLSLNPEDLKRDSELANKWPGVLTWYESLNSKGKKVESLYSHVYIGLRRWVSTYDHQTLARGHITDDVDFDQRDAVRALQ